jgi:hypothetical protein
VHFEPYHLLDGRPHIVLDGSPTDGTVLSVTHWPGYPAPEAIAADLSAQMAFRLLDHPDLIAPGTEFASNNHFDQDGLVSLLAVVDPAAAVPRQAFLEDVARAGDFATFTDRDAARVSMIVAAAASGRHPDLPALTGDDAEQTGMLYAEMLPRLAEVCDDVHRWRDLWAEEDGCLDASLAVLDSGAATIVEHPAVDLAVVSVDASAPDGGGHRFGGMWAAGLHPMSVFSRTSRFVVATSRGPHHEVELRYETWVQYRSRTVRPRRDLVPLASRLQDEECGDATWSAEPVGSLTPRLSSGAGDSSITPQRFIELLVDHLDTAPPAWNPFVPTR